MVIKFEHKNRGRQLIQQNIVKSLRLSLFSFVEELGFLVIMGLNVNDALEDKESRVGKQKCVLGNGRGGVNIGDEVYQLAIKVYEDGAIYICLKV